MKGAHRVKNTPYAIQCNEGMVYAIVLATNPGVALRKFEKALKVRASTGLPIEALHAAEVLFDEDGVGLIR